MRRIRRLPVRIRLALISATLTFAILALFAIVIGLFASKQVHSEFDDELNLTAADLQQRLVSPSLTGPIPSRDREALKAAAAGQAVVRIVVPYGVTQMPPESPSLGRPRAGTHNIGKYRVASRPIAGPGGQTIGYLQYGKPLSRLNHTIARIDLFLAIGVVGGTALAFLAGLALARRAMSPIANLTRASREIARTRDPGVASLPKPEAQDEVADLANTLEDMLRALDDARAETEGALARQREFVADASHELRTPLTSILANLELLEAELEGEGREMAGSALRSSRRMRRLVADLLLLARADAGRQGLREEVDLAAVVSEAAAEAAPVAAGHALSLDLPNGNGGGPIVYGVSDDLHRLASNLIENALVHTPPGTVVTVRLQSDDRVAVLEVSDAGPGISPELRERIFERFVRGQGERAGGGSGLGLAIVRAVAERHGGTVELDTGATGGSRFTVRLPAERAVAPKVRPLRPPATPSAGA